MAKTKYDTPSIEALFDAGVHYGHQTKRWHPRMEPYIFSTQRNVHIIDLEKTEAKIKEACEFLYEVAKKGGTIVFVGTKRQASEIVKNEAIRCGAMYMTERWLGGTITNYRMLKRNTEKLVTLLRKREAGELSRYTKKERLMFDREIEKLDRFVGGIVNLKGTPDAMFVVDARKEKTAIKEAKIAKVPVAALLDTNTDPTNVNYPIPGNDDAIKSIALILKTVGDAIEAGYKDFETSKEKKALEDKVAAEEEAKTLTPVKITSSEDVTEDLEKEATAELEGKKVPEPAPISEEMGEVKSDEEEETEDTEEKTKDTKPTKKLSN